MLIHVSSSAVAAHPCLQAGASLTLLWNRLSSSSYMCSIGFEFGGMGGQDRMLTLFAFRKSVVARAV